MAMEGSQFIIATHSPLMLSQLRGVIYDFDQPTVRRAKWFELGNVKYMYEFFKKHESKFE